MLESFRLGHHTIHMDNIAPAGPIAAVTPSATPLNPRKRGIIVGASSGIGASLARRLAAEAYLLVLIARREDLLNSLADEINQAAGERRAVPIVHDVRNHAESEPLLRRAVGTLGGLDLFVYAAGVNRPVRIDQYDIELDREMLEINLLGAMAWLGPVATMFQSAKSGHIVGISSVAGDRGRVGNPAYGSTKAGLSTYLEALRNRLSRHGVRVLTVKPGHVRTAQLAAAARELFPIPAEVAADDIWRAIRRGRQQIYTPAWWALLMFVVRHMPSILFRRLSF
jgi:short-subunit dehydrogenase